MLYLSLIHISIVRVVTPNAVSTLLEVFSYYFVNAMVTVSAVIFIAGARTMVTVSYTHLQHGKDQFFKGTCRRTVSC